MSVVAPSLSSEQAGWFGRGASSFRLFQQPLVPMVGAEDGRWLLQRPLEVRAGLLDGNGKRGGRVKPGAMASFGSTPLCPFQVPLRSMRRLHTCPLHLPPAQVMMKPGGHGVIWKLMIDTGVFDWLAGQGRQAAIVRQIRCAWAGGGPGVQHAWR